MAEPPIVESIQPRATALPAPELPSQNLPASEVAVKRRWLGYDNAIAAVWMTGGLVCVSLAAVMVVGDNRRVYLPGAVQPVPELCMLYSRVGIDCPGCGLTRTFIHMAHGQLVSAWQTNPVGILVFVFACLQIPLGAAQVIFRRRGPLVETWGRWNDACTGALLIALVIQWIIRLSL